MNHMTAELTMWSWSLAAGCAIGAVFFGGLWWTVRLCMTARQPAFWIIGSLLLRMGIALSGFYVVASGDWTRLLACLCGFMLARLVVTRLTRQPSSAPSAVNRQAGAAREASNAP